ncbi:MAG TPA: hypothetical protein VN200_01840 [Rhodoglobus sp.]|nr:hypothetical protein [Rhodoglobus sp.]
MSLPRSALPVAVGLLVLGTVLRAVFLLWHPPFTTDFYDYEQVSAYADSWYLMHMAVGAPGFATMFVGLAAVTAVLCAERGGLLAVIGGALAAAGGLGFALALAAEGATWGWALDPAVIDAEAGAQLLRGIETGPQLTTPIILAADTAVIPLGVLLQLIALLLAGSVPRWLPIAVLVVMLLGLVPVPVLDGPRVVLESVALIAIGLFVVRARRPLRAAVPAP